MFKNNYIKILTSFLLVLMTLWVATPKVYVHNLLNHNHDTSVNISGQTKVDNKNTDDCDFEKYNTPSYFNVFKFLNNFIPSKPHSTIKVFKTTLKPSTTSHAIYLLRAPPISA